MVGGGRVQVPRSWAHFSWPMCRATVIADGVVFEARGPLRFIAQPFTLRFSEMRSAETMQVPGLANVHIRTKVQGVDKVVFSSWPTSIRIFEDAVRDHRVAITKGDCNRLPGRAQ
jgi:hypothetical protein